MREEIRKLVNASLQELNEELQYDSFDNVDDDTELFGTQAGIDSLSLVRLVIDLEAEVNRRFGKPVALADDAAMSARNSPFRTVGSLIAFIEQQLDGNHA